METLLARNVSALEGYISMCESVGGPSLATCRARWLIRCALEGTFELTREKVLNVRDEDLDAAHLAAQQGDRMAEDDYRNMARAMAAMASHLAG